MFRLPGKPGPPGPPGHKGEPGVPGSRDWNPDAIEYSNMAVKVTDYIKCMHQESSSQTVHGPQHPGTQRIMRKSRPTFLSYFQRMGCYTTLWESTTMVFKDLRGHLALPVLQGVADGLVPMEMSQNFWNSFNVSVQCYRHMADGFPVDAYLIHFSKWSATWHRADAQGTCHPWTTWSFRTTWIPGPKRRERYIKFWRIVGFCEE